uniref:Uncharacterized protein n=1 Tax=Oryza rufipogon TaxID=4529 RepID=A0A0E0NSB4_ORYRU
MVRGSVQRGGVRGRAEVVLYGAHVGAAAVRRAGPDAGVRAVAPRDGARAQHLLGEPGRDAELGEGPVTGRPPRRRQRPDPEPDDPLPRRVRALGREQRDAALQLLRAAAGRQRVGGVLQRGAGRRPARHALHERVQRDRDLRRRVLHRGHVRGEAQGPPRGGRRPGGHRPGGTLPQAQHPAHARRARQARHARPAHLVHRDRHQQPVRRADAGRLPGAGAQGGVLPPGRHRRHAVDGAAPQRMLPDVPHRLEPQQPPRRRRRRPPPAGVADGAGRRPDRRARRLQLQRIPRGVHRLRHLRQQHVAGHLLALSRRRDQAHQHPDMTIRMYTVHLLGVYGF